MKKLISIFLLMFVSLQLFAVSPVPQSRFENSVWCASISEDITMDGVTTNISADVVIHFLEDGLLTADLLFLLNGFEMPLSLPEGGLPGEWSCTPERLTLSTTPNSSAIVVPPTEGVIEGNSVTFTVPFMERVVEVVLRPQ